MDVSWHGSRVDSLKNQRKKGNKAESEKCLKLRREGGCNEVAIMFISSLEKMVGP